MDLSASEETKVDEKSMSNIADGSNEEVIGYLLPNSNPSVNVYKEDPTDGDERLLGETSDGSRTLPVTLPIGVTASALLQHSNLQLANGSAAYMESINDQLDDGQNVAVQLEDGTTAYIRATHKDGLQAVQLQDGTTAYISHTLDLEDFASGVLDNVESVEINSIPISKAQTSSTAIRSGAARLTKAISLGEKAFRCPYEGCNRLYTTQHHLKVHERTHTGDRPFKCTSCKKAFATGYSLKSHTRVHTGEKPYKCSEEYCGKAFKTSGDLQKHLRTHTGERPFKCPYHGCDRAFTTSNIRKVHMRIHTGERPYICPREGCDRTFASATNYKNHIRIHTGEKPYVCGIKGCGKKFTEYSSLYKHHVVHTPIKPYVCNLCGRNYRQTSTLAMHKRSAHGVIEPSDINDALTVQDSHEIGEQSETEELDNHKQVDECQRIQVMVVNSNGDAQALHVSGNVSDHLLEQQLTTAEHANNVILSDPTTFATIQKDSSGDGYFLCQKCSE